MILHSIGHSTRTAGEFLELLRESSVQVLVDVRSFPGSRRCPQFGKDAMREWLPRNKIGYVHLPGLGGRRHSCSEHSKNLWWTTPGFRSYADYALEDEKRQFEDGYERLIKYASQYRVAYMCAEAVWWKCHRRIITDYLLARGHRVLHVMGPGDVVEAEMSRGAVVVDGKVTYPPEQPSLFAEAA